MDRNEGTDIPHPNQLALADANSRQMMAYEGVQARPQEDDEDVIDLRDYWRVIVQRKWTIIFFTLMLVFGAFIATYLMTPIYRSSVTLQIERESAKIVQFKGVIPEGASRSREFYHTQYQLLKSRTLARRVIEQLGLESTSQFMGKQRGSYFKTLRSSVKEFFVGEQQQRDTSPPALEGLLLRNLTVSPVRNSSLVVVHFDSPNRELAAQVVNVLAKNFINTTLERRFDASSYAKTFLTERLKQVRANLEDSERVLVAYAKEREIIDLDKTQGVLMHKVQELNSQIVAAETTRIEAESEYGNMQQTGGEGFMKVLDSPVIQRYKETLANLESEYAEKLRIYKPAYPSMVQLQSQITEFKTKVQAEVDNIRSAVKAHFKVAVREEALLKSKMAELKNEILDLQGRSTDYQALNRDVETNRKLYDGLLQRVKEVGVAAGVGTNNISVVDPGEVARGPIKPNMRKNLLLALILGLFGGIGLAFLFDRLDDTIKSGADLERQYGIPLLGVIPEVDARQVEGHMWQMGYDDPKSALAEAYRSCRTALSFSTTSGAPKILHITSAGAGEGKTTTAISLATAFVQAGAAVLLIDADLRNPSLHKEMTLPNGVGLTNYLAGDHKPSQVIQRTEINNLFVLPTGPIPPNPVELLSTGKMLDLITRATNKFDHLIIDGPPVLGLADALVLANMAKVTVLVVDAGATRKGAVEGALKRLRHAQANVVGGILAKYGQGSSGYGYDYEYSYDYHNDRGDDEIEMTETKQLAS